MMLGYPGAGKTTTAEMISKMTGAMHLNSDRFRQHLFANPTFSEQEHELIYNALDYLTELLLAGGVSVIYDANLNRYKHRQEKYEIAGRTGADPKLMYIKTDSELAKQRATVDSEHRPAHRPFGNMDLATFERLIQQIEPPRDHEPLVELSGDAHIETQLKQKLGTAS